MGKITTIKRGFCVYWIPTNSSSKSVLALTKSTHTFEYRDSKDESYRFTSKATNTDNEGAVKIHLHIEALHESSVVYQYNVRFNSIVYNKDGLLSLSYTVPCDFSEDFTLLRDMVYSHIKHHFHRHVYHENEAGEMLRAYYCDESVNVREDNNPALEFYLNQIKDILNVHNEYLIDTWHLIQELGKSQRKESSDKKKRTLSDREKKIKRAYSESCQQVIDQISFFNTLIYSEQNKDGNLQCAGASLSRMRQLTREINNNIIAMRTLNERAKAIFYDKTIEANETIQAQLSSSAASSSRLGLLSLGLGLLSLAITGWQSCNTNSEKKQTDEAMRLLQESIYALKQSVRPDTVYLNTSVSESASGSHNHSDNAEANKQQKPRLNLK